MVVWVCALKALKTGSAVGREQTGYRGLAWGELGLKSSLPVRGASTARLGQFETGLSVLSCSRASKGACITCTSLAAFET